MNNIVNNKGYNVIHMAIHFHCMSEAEETTLLKSYSYKVNELKKTPKSLCFINKLHFCYIWVSIVARLTILYVFFLGSKGIIAKK